jgi:hypothetical protein
LLKKRQITAMLVGLLAGYQQIEAMPPAHTAR